MGVFEEGPSRPPGMHWQQHDQYIGPAYDPSRDLSPNLPSCDSSMGDADPSLSSGSSCSTPSSQSNIVNNNNNNNNNQQHCTSDLCRQQIQTPTSTHNLQQHPHLHPHHLHNPPPPIPPPGLHGTNLCRTPHSSIYDHVNHHHIPPSLSPQIPKLEPIPNSPTPPTPPPSCSEENITKDTICAGCGHCITDRFLLQAVDRRWHASCLQCCQCRNTLDGEITCFSKNGNIYCKKDYHRLFGMGMKRCARCHATIVSSEFVMRARDLVFHVHCFTCAVCNAPLTKGDHFGMRDGAVLCRLHFEMSPPSPATSLTNIPPIGASNFAPNMHHYPPPFPSPELQNNHPHPHHHHHHHHPPQHPLTPNTPGQDMLVPGATKVPSSYFNGATTTPRQKGRPRKRKPKDLEGMTASLDLNADYLDMPFGRSPGTPGMHSSSQRTKRMRTSFKHHQLRTMKSYFAVNHNPDAKDLKQLSQKTGLPKRVLQVWFQNARAKWRRMMLKQEGKAGGADKCSGSDSMSDLDMYPHGINSMSGSIQSMNPHSPPFMLPSDHSPSSIDCS